MAICTRGVIPQLDNTLFGRHLVSMRDLSLDEIKLILQTAMQFKHRAFKPYLQSKILASCFFEPSTRTRLSFESAAHRLGGRVIGFSDANTSSHTKGESLYDTMKVMSHYADVLILRHPKEGAARMVSEMSSVPVINAGDGANQHPTQALLDLFTISECTQQSNEMLHLVFMGDLKHGRTVHSLVQACGLFPCRLYFVASGELGLPESISAALKQQAIRFSFHRTVDEVIEKADILYVTRLQRERATRVFEQTPYTLGLGDLERAKPNLRILHPLPRVDEIDAAVDATDHAYYFQQASNGLYVRQALLALLLNESLQWGA
jgi:aspartate carbamoyltransferase catalytic subunit